MKDFFWATNAEQLPSDGLPLSLIIGNFDGVHKGHQQLVSASVKWANQNKGRSVVLTFHPHPVSVLFPGKKHTRLFDLVDQKNELQRLAVDGVFLQSFTREFSQLSADEFLQDFVVKTFHPQHIVVGFDFFFGRERQGTTELLKAFCKNKNIEVTVMPPFQIAGEKVSTSAIRQALLDGDLDKARLFLGREYYVKGIVQKGEGRGRTLGFPTANIKPVVDFYPKTGVYATMTKRRGQRYHSVTNIGLNRTFVEGDMQPIKVETFIFDFNESIYGEEIEVDLLYYLREEQKFPSVQHLMDQIGKDVIEAKKRFGQ
jgi:riboflavin kinase / FMN adenylyltransferase